MVFSKQFSCKTTFILGTYIESLKLTTFIAPFYHAGQKVLTKFTLVRLLHRICMVVVIIQVCKSLVIRLKVVWLFCCVGFQMCLKTITPCKFFATGNTHAWRFTRVGPHMDI